MEGGGAISRPPSNSRATNVEFHNYIAFTSQNCSTNQSVESREGSDRLTQIMWRRVGLCLVCAFVLCHLGFCTHKLGHARVGLAAQVASFAGSLTVATGSHSGPARLAWLASQAVVPPHACQNSRRISSVADATYLIHEGWYEISRICVYRRSSAPSELRAARFSVALDEKLIPG